MQVPSTKSFARKVSSTGRETKGRVTKRSYKKSYEKVQDFLESRTVIVRPKNEQFFFFFDLQNDTTSHCLPIRIVVSLGSLVCVPVTFLEWAWLFSPGSSKKPFPTQPGASHRFAKNDTDRDAPSSVTRSRRRGMRSSLDQNSLDPDGADETCLRVLPLFPPGSYLSSRGIPPPSPVGAALATISPTIP